MGREFKRKFDKRKSFSNNDSRQVLRADKLKWNMPQHAKDGVGGKVDKVKDVYGTVNHSLQEPVSIKVRKYDQIADFITQNTITGYDAIFGKPTVKHNLNYKNSTKAILGFEHEMKYLNDKYYLRAIGRRFYEQFIYGVDMDTLAKASAGAAIPLSVIGYRSFVSKLVAQLRPELYSGPLQELLTCKWADADAQLKTVTPSTGMKEQMTPLAAVLHGYETDVTMAAEFIWKFEQLKASFPKLRTNFYRFAAALTYVESQIKRSRYTGQISSLLNALKRRYSSSSVINKVFQTVGMAKKTDGINSPIKVVQNKFQVMNVAVQIGSDAANKMPVSSLFGYRYRQVAATADISTVNVLQVAEWSIWDLLVAIKEDIRAGKNSFVNVDALLASWYSGLTKLNQSIPAWEEYASYVDGLYSRLQNLGITINCGKNIDIPSIKDIENWGDDAFIDGLFVRPISKPVHSDQNSFLVRVPVYANSGMHTNSIESGFQNYYMPSDDKTISYGTVDSNVEIMLRNDPYDILTFQQVTGIGDNDDAIKWKADIANTAITYETVSTFMGEDIPYLEINTGLSNQTLRLSRNQNLIAMLEVRHKYNTPEEQLSLWQTYPLPIA